MKIAIISSTSHEHIGGTEKYARMLISSLKKEHEITEFPIQGGSNVVSKRIDNVKVDERLLGVKPKDMVWIGTYTKKNMKYIYENYDVVIINNTLPPRKWVKNNKTILIQHFDIKAYSFWGKSLGIGIGGLLSNVFFGVGGTIGNIFKKASNVVFFDKTTACEINGKQHFVPLPSEKQTLTNDKRKDFLWIGRLENKQKNIKMAIKIANKTNKLDIYGSGPSEKLVIKKLNNESLYKGFIQSEQVPALMKKYKALILTSNYEGFPFTIVEALHSGLPVIALDNFKSLKFFSKSNAITTTNSFDGIIKAMEQIETKKLSKNAHSFASEKLSYEEFGRKWKNIIKKMHDN